MILSSITRGVQIRLYARRCRFLYSCNGNMMQSSTMSRIAALSASSSMFSSQPMLFVEQLQRQHQQQIRQKRQLINPCKNIKKQGVSLPLLSSTQLLQQQQQQQQLRQTRLYSNTLTPQKQQEQQHEKEGYYYDSQSGIYVPIHDETKVSLYVELSTTKATSLAAIDSNNSNSKNEDDGATALATTVGNLIHNLYQLGIAGIKLPTTAAVLSQSCPSTTSSKDDSDGCSDSSTLTITKSTKFIQEAAATAATNSATVVNKANNTALPVLFLPCPTTNTSSSPMVASVSEIIDKGNNNNNDSINVVNPVNLMFEYTTENYQDLLLLSSSSSSSLPTTATTSLGLFDIESCYEEDPIIVSSNVASILDNVETAGPSSSEGGNRGVFDYIWLSPLVDEQPDVDHVDPDTIIELCEQLMYMDVLGKTMQSRLIVSIPPDADDDVDKIEEYFIEECLDRGINKFSMNINISSREKEQYHKKDNMNDNDINSNTLLHHLLLLTKKKIRKLNEIVSCKNKKLVLNTTSIFE